MKIGLGKTEMKLQNFDFRIWDNIEKKYINT